MSNVTFIEIDSMGQTVTHAVIDRGNGEFTSMLKTTYDEQLAAQSKEITTPQGGSNE